MGETLTYDNIDPKKRSLIMVGLAIGLLAACFDGTVTTTCGPTIATQYHASDMLPWLTTAYLLLETVAIPLAGKMSDLYGRKKLLIIGLTLFGTASLLAGLAWDMWVVILARAFQGAGGGILIPVATAAVSDLYPPESRGKIQGVLGALFGVGLGAGPLIGGTFAAMGTVFGLPGWHFAFLINIPVVLFVIALCRGEFPSQELEGKPVIDFKGVAILTAALIGIVVLFQCLSKGTFKITSIYSLAFTLAIIVALYIFAYIERKTPEPVMAPHIFANRTVLASAVILFLLGFAIVGDELFMGLYLQKVTSHTPIQAGMFIMFMVVGLIIASLVAGATMNRTGIKPWVVAGPVLMATGFFMFAEITVEFNAFMFSLSEFLFGCGGGCITATLMTAVQNSCEHKEVGMVTSAVNLMRNIGSTVGTSVFTLLVNASIYDATMAESAKNPVLLPHDIADHLGSLGLGILDRLGLYGPEVDGLIRTIFTNSAAAAFGMCALLLLIAVIIGLRFKIVSIEQTKNIGEYADNITKDNGKVSP